MTYLPMSDNDQAAIRFFGCEEGPYGEVRESDSVFEWGGDDCHSGEGLYVWCDEYPDEGSSKLDAPSPDAEPVKVDGVWMWAMRAAPPTGEGAK